MWLDGIGFAQPLEDPTKSRIVGKVGYGVMPAGPKAQVSALFADGEGVSTYSKKKGPAWFYHPVGVEQGEPDAHAAGGGRRPGAQLGVCGGAEVERLQGAEGMGRVHADLGQHRAARAADHRAGAPSSATSSAWRSPT